MTKINELLLLLSVIDLASTQTVFLLRLKLNRKAKERMADTDFSSENKRCAVVTGANKGIGLEICRQLASNGIMVVLTARDTERGLQAVESLKRSGLSDGILFHQLDVMSSASIASLADFIKTQFGKLDILVNNAGIGGVIADADGLRALALGDGEIEKVNLDEVLKQTYELAVECLETNYYGVKGVTEALIPFLQLSGSARIVSVSASMGQLKNVSNEMAKEVLSNIDNLTEEKIDDVLNVFLKDFKEDLLEAKGWPTSLSAYTLSKAALNAYTRILAKKFPTFGINCVCPGFVKTDMNCNTGVFSVEEGAKSPVTVALLPDDGPSGQFFSRTEVSNF